MAAATATRGRQWRRRAGAVIVTLVAVSVAVLAFLGTPAPPRLTAVSPADGATLVASPAQVTLVFTSEVNPRQTHVTVASGDGAEVTKGAPRLVGRRVVTGVTISRGGTYLIAYHLVLRDGAEVSGLTRFTVATATATATAAATGSATAAAPLEASGAPGPRDAPVTSSPLRASVTASPDGAGRRAADQAATGGHSHRLDDPLSVTLVCLDVLLAVAVAVIMLRRPAYGGARPRVWPRQR